MRVRDRWFRSEEENSGDHDLARIDADDVSGKGYAGRSYGRRDVSAVPHRSDTRPDFATCSGLRVRSSFHTPIRPRGDRPPAWPGPPGWLALAEHRSYHAAHGRL